ncbi:MAG: choice-of-anchor tandem repeat GloVer-containing protein [Candidatus Korobacteraceae bacterium]|jgi:uncharacterized repeat protein (TIGR03803 family)
MANPRQLRNLIFGLSFGATTAALVIAFMLTVVASQPAQAQTYTVLHNFTGGGDGANPWAGVTLDGAGNLYGTASAGGIGIGYGTVYKLTHQGSSWPLNPLYEFTGGSDGELPLARVIFGPDGSLYGTTVYGADGPGTVFKLRPQPTFCRTVLCPWTETMLYRFSALTGYHPDAEVIFDQAGNLYSTTLYSGSGDCPEGCGVVFELMPPGSWNMETVLYSFSGNDGDNPNGVIFDNAGNLYGTTRYGGSGGNGTVFELMPGLGGRTDCTLWNFGNGNEGRLLYAGLTFDRSGNLYGATSDGGTGGGGTVFELTPIGNCSWTLQTLYSFTGPRGCGPEGTLVMDGAGNLYGTTYCDGANSFGNVWELSSSGIYTSLYDFTGGNDGANPVSNVVIDGSGNLYGTASVGGSDGDGVVWEITP